MQYKLISSFKGLGSSFYDVHLVEDIYTNQPVILKVDYLDKEIEIMERLRGLSFVPKFIRKDSPTKAPSNIETTGDDILIMEYMPGNDLADLIEDELKLNEADILKCLEQLPLLFKEIFDKGVLHGDINWSAKPTGTLKGLGIIFELVINWMFM